MTGGSLWTWAAMILVLRAPSRSWIIRPAITTGLVRLHSQMAMRKFTNGWILARFRNFALANSSHLGLAVRETQTLIGFRTTVPTRWGGATGSRTGLRKSLLGSARPPSDASHKLAWIQDAFRVQRAFDHEMKSAEFWRRDVRPPAYFRNGWCHARP